MRLNDGSLAKREVIRHPGGATVLALTADDEVVLVSQYRVAVGSTLTELPAGKLEPGEDPLICAQRELAEETGYTAATWATLGSFYPSPGYLDEELHLFLATDLTPGVAHPDDGEWLSYTLAPFDDVVRRVLANEIRDAKTIMAVLLTALRRRTENLD